MHRGRNLDDVECRIQAPRASGSEKGVKGLCRMGIVKVAFVPDIPRRKWIAHMQSMANDQPLMV